MKLNPLTRLPARSPLARLTIAILSLFTLSSAFAAATPLSWRDTTYVAHDKAKTPVPGQLARLNVPENSARPDGAQVELALFRFPTTSPTPAAPIIFLHGGPGGLSADQLESPDFRALFEKLRAQSDVILFDQRGCGQSTPTLIPSSAAPASGPSNGLRFTADTLATRDALLAYFEKSSAAVRDRLVAAGHDPHCYTITASAEDLEAIRLALGVPRLRLLAHSYGTQLAQSYLRAHPTSVERVALVGSRGMDTSRKLPVEADAFLAQIADLARVDKTVGEKFPDLLATLRRVLAKLDTTPVAVEMENQQKEKFTLRVGGYALRFIIAKFYLNDPDNTRFLPKLLDELDTGRRPWSLVFNLSQMLRSPISYAWFTTDAASGVTPARAEKIRAQAATALVADACNFPFPDINSVWTMPDLGDAFRAPVSSDVPALFIAATLDGITPVAQTREIMTTFSASRLLVVENAGHTSQFRPPAVHAAIADFFAGKSTPASITAPPTPFTALIATEK